MTALRLIVVILIVSLSLGILFYRYTSTFTPTITTLVGGSPGYNDGFGVAAQFGFLKDIVCDGEGNLHVIDNRSIRKIVIATGKVITLVGDIGHFSNPSGITSDGKGNLYVTDHACVHKIEIATGKVTTLAGSRERGDANGIGRVAQFRYPWGIISDGIGNLYVADQNRIRKIVIATGEVTTVTAGQFNHLTDIISDRSGNLYVLDGVRIWKIVVAIGKVTALAGSASWWWFSPDGIGSEAHFDLPFSITTDGIKNLYVAETYGIRKIEIATGEVTTVVKGSQKGYHIFDFPRGITYDGFGNLYVADEGTHRIFKATIAQQ
ncbi:MAG: hypothetical protein MUF71_01330 [Candidatus Kapabacteria bacterium]|jgi:sugar lactone lactonase YvrE|nr:hypothetical protein [Candidatus Kapabacteria bacterium]